MLNGFARWMGRRITGALWIWEGALVAHFFGLLWVGVLTAFWLALAIGVKIGLTARLKAEADA